MSQAAETKSVESVIETGEVCRWQESIQSLSYFSSLIHHCAREASDCESPLLRLAGALEAECVACGMKVSGQQLLKLGNEAPTSEEKLARLQKGYCARRTCDSRFYQVTCRSAPGVNWKPIFDIKDGYTSAPETGTDEVWSAPSRRNKLRYVVAASCAVLVMILLRIAWQYYAGGAIPIIRPAGKFVIDSDAVLKELSRIE